MTDKFEQTERGRRAQVVLDELKDVFKELETECFDTFRHSDLHDDKGRMNCRLYLKVLDDVVSRLELAVVNGEAARKQLTP